MKEVRRGGVRGWGVQERCGGGMGTEKVTFYEQVYHELRNLHFMS